MTALYVFAVALGLPLLLWFAFVGDALGGDIDSSGGGAFTVISISSVTFAAAFFGVGGLFGTWMGLNALIVLAVAVAAGLMAGCLNHFVFAWLRSTEASSDISYSDIEGSVARIAIPVSKRRRGRIVLDIGGARSQMTASTVDDSVQLKKGDRVVVVGIESNVALVAPIASELI